MVVGVRGGIQVHAVRIDRGRRSVFSVVAAAILVLAGTLVLAWPASGVTSAVPAVLIPSDHALLGAYAGLRGTERKPDAVARIEGQIGRQLAINHQYYKWDTPFPTLAEYWAVGRGMIPFLNWKAQRQNGDVVGWRAIASGSQDGWIVQRAEALKAFGAPIYLTFHHEPENDLAAWGTPADFAAAFRHIVDVFRSRDVTNVAFVWTMMNWTFEPRSGRDPNAYYPGDTYVDLIGVDGFNWYMGKDGASWDSFQRVFQTSNDFAVVHDKPWMAVETGVLEDPDQPGRKGQWFRDIAATAEGWPLLKAVMYFDTFAEQDWSSDSSTSSTQGYAELGADPYFNPGSPAPSPGPAWPLANPLDGGIAGQSLTPENSGGAAASAFDSVVVQGNAALVYDDAHARGGVGLSARHLAGPRGNAFYEWDESFGTQQVWFGRLYVWFDALPGGNVRLVRARDSGGALRLAIDVLSSGQLAVNDSLNQRIATMTPPILTRSWVRIEWRVDHVAGQVEVRLFNSDTLVAPTGTVVTPSGQGIGPSTDAVQIGRSGRPYFPSGFWTDDPAVSGLGFLGPA